MLNLSNCAVHRRSGRLILQPPCVVGTSTIENLSDLLPQLRRAISRHRNRSGRHVKTRPRSDLPKLRWPRQRA